jgi:hypothetical protein
MPYEVKPLACDPTAINGMSERLIVSHYENNCGGAVQRLNAITKELAELDFTSAPIFVINGLKREELIAMNFDDPARNLLRVARRARRTRGRAARRAGPRFWQRLGLPPNSRRWERRSVAAPAGCC